MLAGIVEHRRVVELWVRLERRARQHPTIDIDISIFDGTQAYAEFVIARDHRRLACEAKAELWRHIKTGDVDNKGEHYESVQVFEEMSHTE